MKRLHSINSVILSISLLTIAGSPLFAAETTSNHSSASKTSKVSKLLTHPITIGVGTGVGLIGCGILGSKLKPDSLQKLGNMLKPDNLTKLNNLMKKLVESETGKIIVGGLGLGFILFPWIFLLTLGPIFNPH